MTADHQLSACGSSIVRLRIIKIIEIKPTMWTYTIFTLIVYLRSIKIKPTIWTYTRITNRYIITGVFVFHHGYNIQEFLVNVNKIPETNEKYFELRPQNYKFIRRRPYCKIK